jgi:pSer/pThr/pTyr-binding forkhead associated (FHA) protein
VIVLEVIRSGSAPTRVALPPPVATIGRAPTCTLMLPVGHLSGEHAQLSREGSDVVIRDLRSTNGTAVDRGGQRYAIDAASRRDWVLAVGDEIVLGDALDPVRLRVLELAGSGAVMATTPAPGADGDADDHDLEGRLIASRSIVDLVAVRGHLEHDPVSALRVYKALQPLGGASIRPRSSPPSRRHLRAAARATHVAVLMRSTRPRRSASCWRSRAAPAAWRHRPRCRARPGARQPGGAAPGAGERAAMLTADAQTELAASESIHGGQIRSMLALPLWRGDEIIGLIQADNRASAGMFDESDLELALLLGARPRWRSTTPTWCAGCAWPRSSCAARTAT